MPEIGEIKEVKIYNKDSTRPGDTVNGIYIKKLYHKWTGNSWAKKALAICPLCGKEFEGNFYSIKQGRTRSCGCYRKLCHLHDHTDKIYNGTCRGVKFIKSIKGDAYWLWECLLCGEYFEAYALHVVSGNITSCGCRKTGRKRIDHTGKIYNNTCKAIKFLYSTDHQDSVWLFQCLLCGKYFKSVASEVVRGQVKSCGCLISSGENAIANILQNNNIAYDSHKSFPGLKWKGKLRPDFYITNNNSSWIVEYDGIQHWYPVDFSGKNMEKARLKFSEDRMRDKIKNSYFKKNNIPLIRIPYWVKPEDITLEDLIPDTSKYLLE